MKNDIKCLWYATLVFIGCIVPGPGPLFSTNVKDYGAKGDGITDDTEAIYAALAAAEDGEIYFSRGVYRISRSIMIDLSVHGPLTIRGVAGGSTIAMEGEGAAFVVRGTHDGSALPASVEEDVWAREKFFVLESVEILGKNEEADGIEMIRLMQPVVRNCLFRNLRYGVHLTIRNRNVLLQGNHIYNGRRIGVYLDEVNLHQINIHDNHISYCKEGGIVVRNSEIRNIQIVGNDIEYNFDPDGQHISADVFFDAGVGGSIREGTISGNNIQAERSEGGANIHFAGHPENRLKIGLLSISGNHISNQETSIKLQNVKGISITGNTFIRGYDRHVEMENSENIIFQGNVIDHNPDYFRDNAIHMGGIRMKECQDVVVSDNILEGVSGGDSQWGGAIEVDLCRRVSIHSNHITNPRLYGISIYQSDWVNISHCLISRDGQPMEDGILLRGENKGLQIGEK